MEISMNIRCVNHINYIYSHYKEKDVIYEKVLSSLILLVKYHTKMDIKKMNNVLLKRCLVHVNYIYSHYHKTDIINTKILETLVSLIKTIK